MKSPKAPIEASSKRANLGPRLPHPEGVEVAVVLDASGTNLAVGTRPLLS
jgi:hypothetical protein